MLEKQNTDDQKTAAGDAAALDDVIEAGAKKLKEDSVTEVSHRAGAGLPPVDVPLV